MDKNEFIQSLRDRGFKPSDKQIRQFEQYFTLLVKENELYNLTAITEEKAVYEKHFFDSLSLLFSHNYSNKTILDVGAGAGFPSIPLKIMDESIKLSLIDSTTKKVHFIDLLCKELELSNVKTVVARAEEYTGEKFDVVTARGVASLNVLLELCCNLVNDNGIFIAMKGSSYQEELNNSRHAIEVLGYNLESIEEYHLPTDNSLHCNLYFKKIKNHDIKYPRVFGQIKNKPL